MFNNIIKTIIIGLALTFAVIFAIYLLFLVLLIKIFGGNMEPNNPRPRSTFTRLIMIFRRNMEPNNPRSRSTFTRLSSCVFEEDDQCDKKKW